MATLSKGKTFTNGETVTPQKLHELVDLGTVSGIVNADIAAGAAIADSKLAQITTAGKVLPAAVQGTAVVTADPRLSDARVPVPHGHAISDTTGLQTALDGKAASSHTHTIANVTGLQTALDGKQASGSYAAASHTHDDRYYTETEIDTKLSGLPVSGHTHTIANVTGLQTALDGKQAAGNYVVTTDSRLSDSRFPTLHYHSADQITSGSLSNDRLYATSANAVNNLVLRDASGNFSAGIITATLSGNATNVTGTVAVANGGTGAITAANARTNLGLGNSATLNTGTTSGTVAAGDHTHSNYVANGGSVATIMRVASMPATPNPTTLYIVIP